MQTVTKWNGWHCRLISQAVVHCRFSRRFKMIFCFRYIYFLWNKPTLKGVYLYILWNKPDYKVTKLLLYFLGVLYLNSNYKNLKIHQGYSLSMNLRIQSNLCPTTTLGTQNLWPMLTGGRCSEVASFYKNWKWYPKMVAAIDKWSLLGRWSLTQVWLQFWFFIWPQQKVT